MGLPKLGLLQPAASDWVGQLEVADIGFPAAQVAAIASTVDWLSVGEMRPLLPRRRREAHKGEFGHLLIIAGSEGYTGAPVLCAHAAARSGVGLVTLAVPRSIYPVVAAQCPPEVMPCALDRIERLTGYDALAIGPGLGRDEQNLREALSWLDECRVPLVLDADGLNALARNLSLLNRLSAPLVLTPHPGEMGRLLNKSAAEVQTQRWELARQFAADYGVVLALKGAGTVVTDKSGRLWINSTGNPGMAKGGMGDALTGLIGGLLAQGLSPLDATRLGVFLHGLAGDIAAERWGQRAMLATDLINSLGEAFALRES
jgi:NAD(P)H-hydrate epimerase